MIQCDKNIGMAILSNDLTDKLALLHLADTNTYRKLNVNPLLDTIKLINDTLLNLSVTNHLCQSLYQKLVNSEILEEENILLQCIRFLVQEFKVVGPEVEENILCNNKEIIN